jgi:hypothetical protein
LLKGDWEEGGKEVSGFGLFLVVNVIEKEGDGESENGIHLNSTKRENNRW